MGGNIPLNNVVQISWVLAWPNITPDLWNISHPYQISNIIEITTTTNNLRNIIRQYF